MLSGALHRASGRAAAAAGPRRAAAGATGGPRRRLHSRRRPRASLYDVLGVPCDASQADVRSAYRRLAADFHPDLNPSLAAADQFQAVKLAAQVLSSPELRAQYDRDGLAAIAGADYRPLHELLRRAGAKPGARGSPLGERGGDIATVLGLQLSEAVTGSACTVTTGATGACPDCKGTGADPSASANECPMCRGRGEVTLKRWVQAGAPRLRVKEACPSCQGSGQSKASHCRRCAGEGRVQVRRRVRIRVPAGVVDGQVLRIRGQGHSGRFGGPPGDLLVRLQVYDLADMTREGDDLHSRLAVPLYDALLGGSVVVQTVRGKRSLAIPAGTQHGQQLCARGAGVARPGVGGVAYGHHYFTVEVEVPDGSRAQREDELALLQQLARVVRGRQPEPPGPPAAAEEQQRRRRRPPPPD